MRERGQRKIEVRIVQASAFQRDLAQRLETQQHEPGDPGTADDVRAAHDAESRVRAASSGSCLSSRAMRSTKAKIASIMRLRCRYHSQFADRRLPRRRLSACRPWPLW